MGVHQPNNANVQCCSRYLLRICPNVAPIRSIVASIYWLLSTLPLNTSCFGLLDLLYGLMACMALLGGRFVVTAYGSDL